MLFEFWQFFEALIFLKFKKCILSFDNSTAMYKDLKNLTLGGFEPGFFCFVGGRDDQYATPPGHEEFRHFVSRQIGPRQNWYSTFNKSALSSEERSLVLIPERKKWRRRSWIV
jgi:hypothetical protein